MQIRSETLVGFFILSSLAAFFYMTFQIGAIRLDKSKYALYIANFKDISGVSKKAEVKIAGVKVGWIEAVSLINEGKTVEAKLMVPKEFYIYNNAQAVVRQEGLLGTKYLELIPGDPDTGRLPYGGVLARDSRDIVTVDDLMQSFKKIANNVEQVSQSLKDSLAGPDGSSRIKDTIYYFGQAAQKIAHASETLERLVVHNEENINKIMTDVSLIIHNVKDKLPQLADSINAVASNLNSDYLPSFTKDVHKIVEHLSDEFLPKLTEDIKRISNKLDSDFLPRVANGIDNFSDSFTSVSKSVENAAHDIRTEFKKLAGSIDKASTSFKSISDRASSGFKNIDEVAQKINKGEGFLGKIVNDDSAYYDIKSAVSSIKKSLDKIERIAVIVDAHVESMQGPVERRFSFPDAKGYVNLRIHPSEDYFYLAGFAFSQRGYLNRTTYHYRYFDEKNNEILPSEVRKEEQLFDLVARKEIIREKRDSMRLNLQVGKIFKDIALRIGLFEGTFGSAVDYIVPLPCDAFKWVTTFEIFDIRGRNRLFWDDRPHMKWLNRIFITPNLYMTFGADDIASRYNKNVFVGAGLRFSDDDLKYIITRAPVKF